MPTDTIREGAETMPDTGREEGKWPNAREVANELAEHLEDIVRRFERAVVLTGTDLEYAQIATAPARAALNRARGSQ